MTYELFIKMRLQLVLVVLLIFPTITKAATGNWTSSVTAGSIVYTATEPSTQLKDASGNDLTVVYLENLAFNKIGGNSNATAGSMAIGDKTVTVFENAGLHLGAPDVVQVAALGSGVFDYTLIFNTEESDVGNLRTNCPLGWGALASNLELWQSQGSSYLVETAATAPVIFFYNTDDALYYQDQIAKLKTKLTTLGVANSTLINYGTGHSVPQTSSALSSMYSFFNQHLTPPNLTTAVQALSTNNVDVELSFSPNPVKTVAQLQFKLQNAGKAKIQICNLSGSTLYKMEKHYYNAGIQRETIQLQKIQLPRGIYFVKLSAEGLQSIQKFIKD